MKTPLTLLISILLNFSINAKDLAHYDFSILEKSNDGTNYLLSVKTVLNEDREIKISTTKTMYPEHLSIGNTQKNELIKPLHEATYNYLKNFVISLSNAKITVISNQAVCMMMPGPAANNDFLSVLRGYDFYSQIFQGEMMMVLGPKGCWVANKVFPSNDSIKKHAVKFKASIKSLVIDFID